MSDEALKDEEPNAEKEHRKNFDDGLQALEDQMKEKFGTDYHQATGASGYAAAHFLYRAMRHASWSVHEDMRSRFYRLILQAEHMRKDAEVANKELVKANQEGASALVSRIESLKRSSDYWQKWLTIGTWVLALATIALALVEHFKHA